MVVIPNYEVDDQIESENQIIITEEEQEPSVLTTSTNANENEIITEEELNQSTSSTTNLFTVNNTNEEASTFSATTVLKTASKDAPSKKSRLETVIQNIVSNIDYSDKFNSSVIDYLKTQLKDDKKEAVRYMKVCFDVFLDDEGFIKWLANAVGYKPFRINGLLATNKHNKRNSKIPTASHLEIYDFWLNNSITSNDSANNTKKIPKMTFLKQFKNIEDPDIIEKEKQLKSGSKKVMYEATKKIYTDSVRKLHKLFNETQTVPVSVSFFYNLKPFYCQRPSEKEKQSCLCINCLNPHVVLKSINGYRSSKKLSHTSRLLPISQNLALRPKDEG